MSLAPGQISLNAKRYWTRSPSDDNDAVHPLRPGGRTARDGHPTVGFWWMGAPSALGHWHSYAAPGAHL
ncbi:hypothetical protein ACFVJH_34580 [Streptomyces decoyicus]|uniref:hypothetical protein n=1 Tax=Streptomyces decoyicus TaxID=249567 RepID=UPI003634F004